MSWYEKLVPSRIRTDGRNKHQIPEGLWNKCEECGAVLYGAELERNLQVCPKCGHHMYLGARQRLRSFLDEGNPTEIGDDIEPIDFLKFKDGRKYRDRLAQAQKASEEKDALVAMRGLLKGAPVIAAAFEFGFMAGSMGSVVGERFVRAAQAALQEHIPFICFTASGGARIQ